MANLALFDFDGTITSEDSFVPFIVHAVDPFRMALGKVLLSPLVLAYKVGLFPATKLRGRIVAFGLRGRREDEVRRAGQDFSRAFLGTILRPEAMERIRWHKARGDTVVVVSASLDVYLSDWCQAQGLALICTELEARDGVLTGKYLGGDCSGLEKARRVRQKYDVPAFDTIFAYGDTPEDAEMLKLASKRYFQWREVS